MIHKIDEGLIFICEQIIQENKSIVQWIEIESDDMFQHMNYLGGFDATEEEFCFSVYINDTEYWFQFSLEDAKNIKEGLMHDIEISPADR